MNRATLTDDEYPQRRALTVQSGPAPEMAKLADTLRTVSDELFDLGLAAGSLQLLLSQPPRTDGRCVGSSEALQSLDSLTQHLRGIAVFLAALAPTLSPDCLCDAHGAAHAVTLSRLARRLLGAIPDESPNSGVLEMFDAQHG